MSADFRTFAVERAATVVRLPKLQPLTLDHYAEDLALALAADAINADDPDTDHSRAAMRVYPFTRLLVRRAYAECWDRSQLVEAARAVVAWYSDRYSAANDAHILSQLQHDAAATDGA